MSMVSSASRRRRRVTRRILVSGLGALLLVPAALLLSVPLAPSGVASAVTPVGITGTGSSFAGPALKQWASQTDSLDNVSINFNWTSSVVGLNEYAQGLINFAASDIGYSTGQANYTPGGAEVPYQYMPDVGGAICMAYNLDSPAGQAITNLRLDTPTLLEIFTGQIKTWNAPQIAALNPGVPLPDFPVEANVRSDGAGESYILSDYFDTLDPAEWNAFTSAMGAASGPQAIWPSAPVNASQIGPYDLSLLPAYSGSDAVIEATKDDSGAPTNTSNSITYVETNYALLNHLPCASIENPAGQFVEPSSTGDAIALTQDQLLPDLEQILTGVFLNSNPQSYPISAYSYLITQEGQTSPPVGVTEGDYVEFIACQGQETAAALGYTPIPPNLVVDDFNAVNRIAGATQLPAPTASNCPNPYLTGALALPGEPIQLGTAGASGTTTSGATTATTQPGDATSGGTATGAGAASNAAIAAEVAAAQKKTEQVAQASARRAAAAGQAPGLALVDEVGKLLSAPFSSGLIWLWTLLLVGVFAVLPAGIAIVGRHRRPPRAQAVEGEQ
jgi:phosphate transport system substrate-binding protein